MDQLIEFVGNHYILSGIWAGLAAMLIYSLVGSRFSPVKELTTHDATLLMNKQDALVLDIRQPAEFKKGHILGAKQLKQEQLNKAEFGSLEKHKDKPIICSLCNGNDRETYRLANAEKRLFAGVCTERGHECLARRQPSRCQVK